MSEVTPAQKYIEVHGKAVEDWLARFIEGQFGRVEMGHPSAVSEFGIAYAGYIVELDATQSHESMMASLTLLTTQSLPTNPKSCTLVWRILPQVYDRGADFETDQSWPNVVRVRYRCHTIEGTTDFKLNEMKAAQVAKEWDQPHHGD